MKPARGVYRNKRTNEVLEVHGVATHSETNAQLVMCTNMTAFRLVAIPLEKWSGYERIA